jgi:pilus assembly protein CpaB
MKNRRLFLALLIALVVSVIATSLIYSRVKRQLAKAATTRVVVSSTAMEAGSQVKAEQLVLVDWPSSLAIEGAFTKPDDVVGRILLYPVAPKEPIRNQLLAAPGSAIGLVAKIPDGMRAVAVVTNDVNNVSGFLFPGSRVDVLVSFRPDQQKEAMTTTVVQNVEVLSTGERLEPNPEGKPEHVKVVTLLLTPDDAQKLALAESQGTVQFVLRNGQDKEQTGPRPVLMKELQDIATTPTPVAKVTRAVAAAPPPRISAYEVEVFDGTKKSVQKF